MSQLAEVQVELEDVKVALRAGTSHLGMRDDMLSEYLLLLVQKETLMMRGASMLASSFMTRGASTPASSATAQGPIVLEPSEVQDDDDAWQARAPFDECDVSMAPDDECDASTLAPDDGGLGS